MQLPQKADILCKINGIGTDRKPVCDFLLGNNTELYPISHRFQTAAAYWSNYCFSHGDASV